MICLQLMPKTIRSLQPKGPSTLRTLNATRKLSSIVIGNDTSVRKIYYLPQPCQKRHLSTTTADSDPVVLKSADYYGLDPSDNGIAFGDYSLMASQTETGRQFVDVKMIGQEGGAKAGDVVWIRGRVSGVRAKGNALFVVIRSGSFHTIQTCHFKDKLDPENSKRMMKYASAIPFESIVDIMGIISSADVKSCTVSTMEIHIQKVRALLCWHFMLHCNCFNVLC